MADLTSSALQQCLDGLTLPDGAKVWMYTANRVLTDAECKSVQTALSAFRASWAAHGSPLAV